MVAAAERQKTNHEPADEGTVMSSELEQVIEEAWEARDLVNTATGGPIREAVELALSALDDGEARVAEREADGSWRVNQWLKKAVLLSFRLNDMHAIPGGPGGAPWWDKVPSKFEGWGENRFRDAGFRAVPHCVVRRSAYIAPGVILMPSFVNLGAYVDKGTMVDTWATVGSCAQIGKNVHLSGGAGIGGVLEPLQAGPASSSAPRPRSSTAPRARSSWARCRPIRWWCRAACPASRCPTAARAPASTVP